MTETSALPECLDIPLFLDALPIGILILDSDGQVRWLNEPALGLLGCDRSELLGLSEHDLPLLRSPIIASGALLTPVARPETRLRAHSTQLTDTGGEAFRLVSLTDVTDTLRAVKSRTLGMDGRDSTRMDPLTCLLTRKSLMKELVSEVSRSRRYQNPLSIIILRPYADPGAWDALGEDRRAAILKATAQALKEQLRWVDEAGRWDRDCLLLVLPETHAEAARQLAEKVSSQVIQLPGEEGGILTQCVITEWRKGDDAQTLIARAEALLEDVDEDCSAISG